MQSLIVIMGVSGSGKSTVSETLGQRLNYLSLEGDDYHPEDNIKKMASGIALTDDDRKSWLVAINNKIDSFDMAPVILACSALTPYVQSCLEVEGRRDCIWIFLDGSKDLIKKRLKSRQNHFMPSGLLDSQFEALTPPKAAISISIDQTVEDIVNDIIEALARV